MDGTEMDYAERLKRAKRLDARDAVIRWAVKAFIVLHLWLWLAAAEQRQQASAARLEARVSALEKRQQAAQARLEARVRALEARRPVDVHVRVERAGQAAAAVYAVLPRAGWAGR